MTLDPDMSLSFSASVPVFDANVGIGHRHNRRYPYDSADGLLEEMARHGVDRALVYHVQGELISPSQGNEQLADWMDGHEELVSQYVAGSDPGSLAQLKELRADRSLTSVRLQNTTECRVPFTPWVWNTLLDWLSSERIPLWVSLADTDPKEIHDTLVQHPDLPVVLVGAHYTHTMMVRPLLNTLPNASLELSRFENIRGIEKLVDEYGPSRFLYGSFFPRYAMGPVLFYPHRLELADGVLEQICSTNLERILNA